MRVSGVEEMETACAGAGGAVPSAAWRPLNTEKPCSTQNIKGTSRSSRNQQASAGGDMEKREPCALLVGMQIGAATVENSIEDPQKIKNGTTL